MTSSSVLGGAAPDVTPGTMPDWSVVFSAELPTGREDRLTVGSDSYEGTLSLTLPPDLSGGRYEIVIEGLTDEDYQRIRLTPGTRLAAEVYLWWRDSPGGILGDLGRAAGLGGLLSGPPATDKLVAVIRVDSVRRRAGERRYEAVITGRERAFARLGEIPRPQGGHWPTIAAAARALTEPAGVELVSYDLEQITPPPAGQDVTVFPGTALEAVRTIRDRAAAALGLAGLPPAVIRDGRLHLGRWTGGVRPLPVSRTLDRAGGLASAERGADSVETATGPQPAKGRAKVTAVALGRPDIKPGDLVQISLPPEDFPVVAAAGSGFPLLQDLIGLLGPDADDSTPTRCRVGQVSHRLSRRQGFVTTVEATTLAAGDDGWDTVTAVTTSDPGAKRGTTPADHASAVAGAVAGIAAAVAQRSAAVRLRAGQIRAHAEGRADLADVWYPTRPATGQPSVRQAPITPDAHGEAPSVPLVTPFAYGGYGLVLPRYPGTRVLLADGGPDVLDVGCVWRDDQVPPADRGDWWLVLPIGAPTMDLQPADQAAPPEFGDASHDLIDSAGRRILETAGLTLRVTDQPTRCNDRPDPGDSGSIVIENNKGGDAAARVVIKADGSIEIHGKSITLDASGDVKIKAANVKVNVSGTMDVSPS